MRHPVVSTSVIAALFMAPVPVGAQDSEIIAVIPDKLKWASTPIEVTIQEVGMGPTATTPSSPSATPTR
jgi:hypothetical protein